MFINPILSYDGELCTDYGLMLVNLDNGMQERTFGIEVSIKEEQVPGRDTPYYQGYSTAPKSIPLVLAKQSPWTDEEQMAVVKWLYKNEYKPLVSNDNPSIIYYCMPEGKATFGHNGFNQGYVQLTMRCDSPYGYLPTEEHIYDVNGTETVILINGSNLNKPYYPWMQVTINSGNSFSIQNLSEPTERIFTVEDVLEGETLTIDHAYPSVETDELGFYRMGNTNKKWFRLLPGRNTIKITGNVTMKLKMQYPVAM